MTSHPGAKRLDSIQTGLMVTLSHRLELRAVKGLYTDVNSVVIGVGTLVSPPRANREFTTSAAATEECQQHLFLSDLCM